MQGQRGARPRLGSGGLAANEANHLQVALGKVDGDAGERSRQVTRGADIPGRPSDVPVGADLVGKLARCPCV